VKRTLNKYVMASALIASVFLAPVMSVRADDPEPEQQDSNWPLCTDSLNIPARQIVEPELEPGDVHVTADNGMKQSTWKPTRPILNLIRIPGNSKISDIRLRKIVDVGKAPIWK